MNIKCIVIVLGEPYSTFSEIIGKYFKKVKKFKKKIIIIGNKDLLKKQLKTLNHNFKLYEINKYSEAKKNIVNIIDIKFEHKKTFSSISTKSNKYIEKCFNKSLQLINDRRNEIILINGPISKKMFLKKNYSGITEYLSSKSKSKNEIMLIYNRKLSVSPLTTHIPIKFITKRINKERIFKNVVILKSFYKNILKQKARIAILCLNPHCETIDKFNEDEKVIIPAIKYLKRKGINVDGPFSADTFF